MIMVRVTVLKVVMMMMAMMVMVEVVVVTAPPVWLFPRTAVMIKCSHRCEEACGYCSLLRVLDCNWVDRDASLSSGVLMHWF